MKNKNKIDKTGVGDSFNSTIQTLVFFIFEIVMFYLMFSLIFHAILQKQATEECKELNLDLFDYSDGGLFFNSTVICINQRTNQITKINLTPQQIVGKDLK